jgi:aminopeptidase N
VAEINDLEDVQVNFDGITYAKGASVLRQLVAWVGQKEFMAGVSQYFKKHAFGNTELADLLVELEATSGRELRSWSKLWLETAGVNTMRPAITLDEAGVITAFEVIQTAIAEQPTIRPHRMAIGFYDLDGDRMVRTHHLELDVDGPSTTVHQLVGKKRPAIILLNDGDLAYTKIRLDDESFAAAVEHLSKFDDSLARALIWGAAWDATRDAETGARAFIKLVLANIATETESTTILTLLRQLVTAAGQFVSADARVETLEDLADALWVLAQAAPAGSDSQLQTYLVF